MVSLDGNVVRCATPASTAHRLCSRSSAGASRALVRDRGVQDWRYVHPWQRVSRGDSEERVVALLGRPHRIVFEQTDKAAWESEHNIDWYNAESVKRYRYILLSITGEEYDVAFDSSGRAVSKFHVTSP